MKRTVLAGIVALLVLLSISWVSAYETIDMETLCAGDVVTDQENFDELSNFETFKIGLDDVSTVPFGGYITESYPSYTAYLEVPEGVYNNLKVEMKFYQNEGKDWSDLRLKLVDSSGEVLVEDDGPWMPFTENGERSVTYNKRFRTGEEYRVVVEKISLEGDTWFDGTVTLQS